MREISTISDLRELPITTETILVKGYLREYDGGGGLFSWRADPEFRNGEYSIENYGTIIKSDIVGNNRGSWIRQYNGNINIIYFGAFGYYADYTINIQRAIDFASLNSKINAPLKGTTVYIPNGSYKISTIKLKDGVSIVGESMESSILYAISRDDNDYMFIIDEGSVKLNISNLNLSGQNSNNGAFLIEAKPSIDSPYHGGLWNSRFSNIFIYGFKGHGVFFKGGGIDSNYLLPNQFNIFENIRIFNFGDDSNSLRIIGQNGQLTFLNCEFDGYFNKTIDNVYTFKRGKNVWIENEGFYHSAVISFINCTIQYSDYGIYISWAQNITIDNCWFEMLGVAISIKGSNEPSGINMSKSINVLNSRFADAAGFGELKVNNFPAPMNIKKGQCLNISNSLVNVHNNYVAISLRGQGNVSYYNDECRFIVAYNNKIGGVSVHGNSFQIDKLGLTYGIVQTLAIDSNNSINCSGHKLINIQSSGVLINRVLNKIISSISAGETLTMIVNCDFVKIENSFNIRFNSENGISITLRKGACIQLMKMDDIVDSSSNMVNESYHITSIVGNRG